MRFLSRISVRGWFLFGVGGVVSFLRGWSYFHLEESEIPTYLSFAGNLAPIWFFGILWMAIGAVCAGTVSLAPFKRFQTFCQKKMLPWCISLVLGINFFWMLSFIAGQFMGSDRAWVTALSYYAIAHAALYVGASVDVEDK